MQTGRVLGCQASPLTESAAVWGAVLLTLQLMASDLLVLLRRGRGLEPQALAPAGGSPQGPGQRNPGPPCVQISLQGRALPFAFVSDEEHLLGGGAAVGNLASDTCNGNSVLEPGERTLGARLGGRPPGNERVALQRLSAGLAVRGRPQECALSVILGDALLSVG